MVSGEEELGGKAHTPPAAATIGEPAGARCRRPYAAARLAVQDALAAIDAADRPAHRPDHRRDEIDSHAGGFAQRADLARLALDERQLGVVGRHRVLRTPSTRWMSYSRFAISRRRSSRSPSAGSRRAPPQSRRDRSRRRSGLQASPAARRPSSVTVAPARWCRARVRLARICRRARARGDGWCQAQGERSRLRLQNDRASFETAPDGAPHAQIFLILRSVRRARLAVRAAALPRALAVRGRRHA